MLNDPSAIGTEQLRIYLRQAEACAAVRGCVACKRDAVIYREELRRRGVDVVEVKRGSDEA